MINDTTSHLKLPLPHKDNYLEDDVLRLRDALTGVDTFAQNTSLRVTEAERELTRKADAAGTTTAMQTLEQRMGQRVDQVAGSIPKLSDAVNSAVGNVAASSLAAKTAYDRGTAGVNAAAAAHGAANAAQGTANEAKNMTNLVRTAPAAWCVPQAGGDGKLNAGWIGGGGMLPVGHIALLPFRNWQLPRGWYFCNGTRYNNGSGQANILNALTNEFKYDWGITNNGSTTNVPNWFYGGRGPAMRAVDGSSRQVGSVEDGAIQNIWGEALMWAMGGGDYAEYAAGVFSIGSRTNMGAVGSSNYAHSLVFNAASQVATANEVRMLNRGMTPAIFLGV